MNNNLHNNSIPRWKHTPSTQKRKNDQNPTIRFRASIHISVFVTINFSFIALCYFPHCPYHHFICLGLVVLRVTATEAVLTSNDELWKIITKAFVAYYMRRRSKRHTYNDMKDFSTFVKLPPPFRAPSPHSIHQFLQNSQSCSLRHDVNGTFWQFSLS